MIRFAEVEEGLGDIDLLSIVDSIFQENGWLEKKLGFEHRPSNLKWQIQFANSLLNDSHLLFEAGTGVGKSLAYLIPAILFSKLRKRPCVVATNTIDLQEQLLDKDIPAVRQLMDGSSSPRFIHRFPMCPF